MVAKPKAQDKAQDKASSEATTACTDVPDALSWIPVSVISIDGKDKKPNAKFSATLVLRYISTKLDKFGRNVCYFACINPEALCVVKQDMDAQGLNSEMVSLPFWQGAEGEYMLRVSRQNCSLTDEQLTEKAMPCPVEFKYFTGKRQSGYTIYI
jgi:hypothetical protein